MKTNLLKSIFLIATCFVSQNIWAYDFSTIILSCTDHGTVVINNDKEFTNDIDEVDINNGAENTFVFKPNAKNQLTKVLINGEDVTSSVKNNQLTTMISAGSKMNVVFSQMTGDVNGDGKVDISDVVKLVNIILGGSSGEEPETTYYWYVGHTDPSTMNSIIPLPSNSESEGAGWRTIGTSLPTYSKTNPLWDGTIISTAESKSTQYVALPSDQIKSHEGINGGDVTSDAWTINSTKKTLNGVNYTIWTSINTKKSFADILY